MGVIIDEWLGVLWEGWVPSWAERVLIYQHGYGQLYKEVKMKFPGVCCFQMTWCKLVTVES